MSYRRKRRRLEEDDEKDENAGQKDLVEMLDNHIYFYTEVTQASVLKLVTCLHKLNSGQAKVDPVDPKIFLHINSEGGDLLSGLAGADHVAESRIPVVSIVEGHAASAATLISIVAKGGRVITPNSYMLIHQLSSGVWGKMCEIKDEYQNCKMMEEGTTRIYSRNTKIKTKELKDILKHDSYWNAVECLKKGLVDRVGIR